MAIIIWAAVSTIAAFPLLGFSLFLSCIGGCVEQVLQVCVAVPLMLLSWTIMKTTKIFQRVLNLNILFSKTLVNKFSKGFIDIYVPYSLIIKLWFSSLIRSLKGTVVDRKL